MFLPAEVTYLLEIIIVLAVLGAIAKGMEGIWRDLGPLAFAVWLLGMCWLLGWPYYGHRPPGFTAGQAAFGWFLGLMFLQGVTAWLGHRYWKRLKQVGSTTKPGQ